ncbi:MAG: hypothetical protein ACTSVY_14315 [Candidatus Helarchaeota archaeon]
MSLINNLQEAIDALNDMLEVESLIVFDGTKLIFSSLKSTPNFNKIFKSIHNAKDNIGFELGADELEIDGTSEIIKIYDENKRIVIIILKAETLISDIVLKEKVEGIFNYMDN